MPTYVYAIAAADHPLRIDGLKGVGEPACEVRVLRAGPLGVVVSDAPEKLRAKRRDVLAHQGLLEQLLEQGPVLPMRFGLTAPDDGRTVEAVAEKAGEYAERLQELDGCREYNVKVSRAENSVLRQILEEIPQARHLHALSREQPDDPGRKMALGEFVAQQVDLVHRQDAERLRAALAPAAVRGSEGEPSGDTFFNVSYLVTRQQAAAFAEAVHREAERFGDEYAFRTHGPLPPYSFV